MQVFLLAVKPVLVVDGVELQAVWGEATFPVAPGRHAVEVFFPYLGGRSGKAAMTVDVPPGSDLRLVYKTPLVVTSSGKLSVDGIRAVGPGPAWGPPPAPAPAPPVPEPVPATAPAPAQQFAPAPQYWPPQQPGHAPPWPPQQPGPPSVAWHAPHPPVDRTERADRRILIVLGAAVAVLLVGVVIAFVVLRENRDAFADAPAVGTCYGGGYRAMEEAQASGGIALGANLYPWDCSDAAAYYVVAARIDGVPMRDAGHALCREQIGLTDAVVWYDPNGHEAEGLGNWVAPEDVSNAGPDDKGTLMCLQER